MEQNIDKTKKGGRVVRFMIVFAHLYCIGVGGWVGLYILLRDEVWWLFLLNCSAISLFIPLPFLLILALLVRRREIWLECGGILILGLYFYGGLFVTKLPKNVPLSSFITVMTYNLNGKYFHEERLSRVIAVLHAENADVIAFQELTPLIARTLQHDLLSEYPYQVLEPQLEARGRGVISRYPLLPSGVALPEQWDRPPQVLKLLFAGKTITLINVHPPSLYTHSQQRFLRKKRRNEEQIRTVIALAAHQPHLTIVLGDFNVSERSTAYTMMSRTLSDAWREAGWGFGHTYPGSLSTNFWARFVAFHKGIPIPVWSVRLDYIFYSDGWQAIATWMGAWNQSSDHRPVVATLAIQHLDRETDSIPEQGP
jgi:endonuclease/exonuclease/phosphatase (EEP) superfamily protein YafD